MQVAVFFSRRPTFYIFSLLVLAFPIMTFSTTLSQFDGLAPGPYGAGFRTIEHYDYTRTLGSPVDYFGDPLPGEIARPVQVCIWYPVDPETGAARMVNSEYAFPYPEDTRMYEFLSSLQDREITRLAGLLNRNRDLLMGFLAGEVAAIRDAPAAAEEFPVVIYSGNRGSGVLENALLWEYLASFGFIVAAIPSVGKKETTPSDSLNDLETTVRDLELALGVMRDFPSADPTRIVVAGNEFGAQAAILAAMRHKLVDGVIAIAPFGDSEIGINRLQSHFDFNPETLTAPVLWVSGAGPDSAKANFLQSLPYCERTIFACPPTPRSALTYYTMIGTLAPADSAAGAEHMMFCYESLGHAIRYFLDSHLKGDTLAAAMMQDAVWSKMERDGLTTAGRFELKKLPPGPDQFLQILNTRGVDAAAEICHEFDLPRSDFPLLPEVQFNEIGYSYFQRGEVNGALKIFGWCTQAYPGSANSWDSYAEACLAAGDSAMALQSWRQSLDVLPTDLTTSEAIKNFIRENTPRRISELSVDGD